MLKYDFTFSTVGLYHHLSQSANDPKSALSWCFLIIAMMPPVSISLGLMPILHILKGELFPTEIRAVSAGIVNVTNHIPLLINMVVFPIITSANLMHVAMYVFAGFSLAMGVWGVITIKETDDMSLVEVEKMYEETGNRGCKELTALQSKSYGTV